MNKLTSQQRDYILLNVMNLQLPKDAGNKSYQEGLMHAQMAMKMAVGEILHLCTENEADNSSNRLFEEK